MHRSTLPPPPDRVGRLTGTAALSVHATSIAGGTQRDPEGTSREPRRRCYGHRRGISLPKALYQNAARMSRWAEGTTEACGRRDQAGLAARKRRVGAVPAQNEPKSDRPQAKTPMNRRKSRLRRRAAPIVFKGCYSYCRKSRDRIKNGFGRDVTFKPEVIQERIAAKVSGLKRYECQPAYLLISASLFPRSVRSTGSFAVLKTPESIVDHPFDIGGFTAVFLHDFDYRSYRIGQDGRALELQRRSLSTAASAVESG